MSDTGSLDYAANYYQRWLGLTPEQARGAARYMWRNESGLDPQAVNPTSGALGIAQWLGPRKRALQDQYGANPSFDEQLAFSSKELAGPESATLNRLRQAKTEKQAYDVWGASYERPGSTALAKAGVGGSNLPPEGYYGGRLHVNIPGEPPTTANQLLSLITLSRSQQQQPQEEPPSTASALVSMLIAQTGEQGQGAAPTSQTQPPEQREATPAQIAPNLFAGSGETPLAPLNQGPQLPSAPIIPQQGQQQATQIPPLPQAGAPPIVQQPLAAIGRPQRPAPPSLPAPRASEPPKSATDLLSSIFSSINPVGSAQAAEPPKEFGLGRPGAEMGMAASSGTRSPVTPSGGGISMQPPQGPMPGPLQPGPQPQLPPRPAGGASGIQAGVEQVIGASGMPAAGPGGGAGQPPHPPGTPPAGPAAPPPSPKKSAGILKRVKDTVTEAIRDAQIKVVPMAAGEPVGQAIAKDYANIERLARWRRTNWDSALTRIIRKEPGAARAMWEAMDNASVAAQVHGPAAGQRYIDALPKAQRELITEMDQHGVELWERARDAGMVGPSAERLPFYVPRAIVDLTMTPPEMRSGRGGGLSNLDQPAVNIRAQGPMRRTHLMAEETETAAQQRMPGGQIVRDIRVLPLAYEKLERNIAGRRMINDLKAVGLASGKPVVSEGVQTPNSFTLPHPAFSTMRPRIVNGEAVMDEAGNTIFDRVPLYIDKAFEGPLRAIARSEDGVLYRGAMMAKAGAMSLIMNSPLIHNAVVYGKAFPGMPGKMITFHFYTHGERLLNDPRLMEQAIGDGMVPIGQHGYLQDIQGIAEDPNIRPGRSMTAKAVGAAVDPFSPKAGDRARSAIDQAGEFWHYKMLWKQVAKVQIGLYDGFKTHLLKKGVDPDVAGKLAGHLANRYAGVLPNEAMSQMARKILNNALFSRSFTASNLGVFKDAINGLPKDVRAQIGRDLNELELSAMRGIARRKAIAVLITDVALFYGLNAVAESGLSMLRGDTTLDEEAKGYVDRVHRLIERGRENVLDVLNPFDDMLALSPLSEHEPGKQDRIKIGTASDGTAIYGRNPFGKFAEEAIGWIQNPVHLLKNKEGTIARPILNILQNDRGFGQAVYSKTATGLGAEARAVGNVVWELLRNQLPENQIRAGLDMLQGKGGAIAAGQALAPLAGFTVSKGAPGGPQVGEMYANRQKATEQWNAAKPKIKELVEAGKDEEARKLMQSVGMSPGLMKYYMRIYRNPASRLSPRAQRDFQRTADPEAKRRMQMDMERFRPNP